VWFGLWRIRRPFASVDGGRKCSEMGGKQTQVFEQGLAGIDTLWRDLMNTSHNTTACARLSHFTYCFATRCGARIANLGQSGGACSRVDAVRKQVDSAAMRTVVARPMLMSRLLPSFLCIASRGGSHWALGQAWTRLVFRRLRRPRLRWVGRGRGASARRIPRQPAGFSNRALTPP